MVVVVVVVVVVGAAAAVVVVVVAAAAAAVCFFRKMGMDTKKKETTVRHKWMKHYIVKNVLIKQDAGPRCVLNLFEL